MKVGGGAAGGGVEWRKPGGAGGCSEPGSGAGGELQRRTSSLLAPLLFSTSELRLAARQFPLHKPQSQQQRNASRRGGLHGVKKKRSLRAPVAAPERQALLQTTRPFGN